MIDLTINKTGLEHKAVKCLIFYTFPLSLWWGKHDLIIT